MKKNEAFLMSFVALGLAVLGLIIGGLALSNKSSAATGKPIKTVVDVTLEEFSIQPAHIVVKPGAVTLRVTNTGNLDHNFEVTGLGTLPALHAGETKTLELPVVGAGTYAVICTIPGHAASGMKAMLMSAGNADPSANAQAGGDPGQPVMDNNQMDQMMETAAKKFPEKTAGHGGDLLEPTVQADCTKQYELTAKVVDWEVSAGKLVKAWTYNGVVPAPAIHVNVGDKVRIILHNELPESTSLHLHGIRVPNSMDGVDPYTQPSIKPGASFTYEFTARDPAVGIYHSHHDAQIQVPNGMFGAFLIGDMPVPASLGKVNVVKTYNMVLNDAGTIGLSLNGSRSRRPSR